jgi:ABC-2 type transport system permease protein
VTSAASRPPARGLLLAILGVAAICQRAIRTLFRQPIVLLSVMVFPLVFLLVLGNSLNRQLSDLPLAVVDEAGNALSAELLRAVRSLESGRDLVRLEFPADRASALEDLHRGRVRGVWVLPPGLARQGPPPAFLGDNTDRFAYETLQTALSELWLEVAGGREAAAPSAHVEAYPYLDYLTYLGPAVVCLAIFMGSMVSGGLQVLEDRMYGYHEGYLVTPISTGTLVAGHVLAGGLVAASGGVSVLAVVLLMTPLPFPGWPAVAVAVGTIFLTSLAIAAIWFLLFARARHASILRGAFGIINVLLFYPSRDLYPVESYPPWLQAISRLDPLTHGVSALRDLLLRGAPITSVRAPWMFLLTFTLVAGILTKVLFRREV